MNTHELTGRPPDTQALTFTVVKLWENGLLRLTPDQIVSARNIQRIVMEESVELLCQDSVVQAVGIAALNESLQLTVQQSELAVA